jgi:hypothetical protein
MPGKPVTVEIEDRLHAQVVSAGRLRSQKVTEVYTEALQLWLDWVRENKIPSPFGDLTKQEEKRLRGVLAYMRHTPQTVDSSLVIELFDRLHELYAGK